jgi:tRNA (cytidine/uridine-2'-O-)-methyltransferase
LLAARAGVRSGLSGAWCAGQIRVLSTRRASMGVAVGSRRAGDNRRMLHVILYQPEIPPNTGNVIRLCANAGASLHLIRPLGFELDHAKLRRAGLDYHEFVSVKAHDDLHACLAVLRQPRVFAFTSHANRRYTDAHFANGDALLFGRETSGLPDALLQSIPETHRLRLPMQPDNRSLNLSNAVAIAVYEAWRQLGFAGGI